MSEDMPDAIAVIGMACRFPDADTPAAFWANLRAGRESVSPLSDADILASGVPPERLGHPDYVRSGVLLSDIDRFDAGFFGMSPQEAAITDPQHRLFLECAWAAFEDAAIVPGPAAGRAGIYASAGMNGYLLFNLMANRALSESGDRFQLMIGNDKDFLATRASYKLNLSGPSMTVQTACSSSLVAVHLACQSLLAGECDLALAGGAAIRVPQRSGYLFQDAAIFSPDGHCRAFDAAAAGTIFGSGVGAVLLKPLAAALADGDPIRAIIRGSAINNDGSAKVGFTAPSVDAQADAIAEAQAIAGVPADTISYVEAHGTGTPMGDPIEIAALAQAFRTSTARNGFCAIGSVKTNIGHLDTAAGVAGLIKTVLMLEHRELAPSLHFGTPNPAIDFDRTPFAVNAALRQWKTGPTPRRAGISSFGIGGTNAHAVLEEAPPPTIGRTHRTWQLLTLSARSAAQATAAARRLGTALRERPTMALGDVAHTLQSGRKAFRHRIAITAPDVPDAVAQLEQATAVEAAQATSVAFLFAGQGAQYPGMGMGLYRSEPVFRATIDRCAATLGPEGIDLLALLQAAPGSDTAAMLDRTEGAQPALFAIEYAVATLLIAWGVRPRALLGHSLGEIVAACVAGVFDPDDALRLLALRGRMMQALPGGGMLAVSASADEIAPTLPSDLSIAAINGPRSCVLSGPEPALALFAAQSAEHGVAIRRLHTSHAFHSAMVDPVVQPFSEAVARVSLRAPAIPIVSTLTGDWLTPEQATDPAYWGGQLRACVRFEDGLATLFAEPGTVCLELGPGAGLADLAVRHRPACAIATLPRASDERRDDGRQLTAALGALWTAGVAIDWSAYHAGEQPRRIALPTYPFARERHWIEPDAASAVPAPPPGADMPDRPPIDRWFWAPSWRRTVPPRHRADLRRWLIVGNGTALGRQLRDAGRTVTVTDDSRYDTLFELGAPDGIVYLRALEADGDPAAPTRLFEDLLALVQALGRLDGNPRIELVIASAPVFDVTGGEILEPGSATLLGAAAVIGQEYEGVNCRFVDMDRPGDATATLAGEALADTQDAVVAYRHGRRWVRDFAPVALEPPAETATLRRGGTYLVTGGLGGVGSVVADYLAREVQAKLVLLGRTPLPPEERWGDADHDPLTLARIATIRRLRAAGADVIAIAADVGAAAALADALDAARARFGPIHGLFHAAGIAGGGLMQQRRPEDVARVFRAKVTGTQLLERFLADDPIELWVAFSSVNAVAGGFGQSDYCAANAYLDAFAERRARSAPGRTVSLAWDSWAEAGMARLLAQRLGGAVSGADAPDMVADIVLPADDWRLAEHRILDGHAILPGTALIALAHGHFAARRPAGAAIELRDVLFVAPVVADGGKPVALRLAFRAQEEGERFEISGRDGMVHATGAIRVASDTDLGSKPSTMAGVEVALATPELHAMLEQRGFGPRWHGLVRAIDDGQAIGARLVLPERFAADLAEHPLHPALLDTALGFVRFIVGAEGDYLPLSYGRLLVASPLGSVLDCTIRLASRPASGAPVIGWDAEIRDPAGRLLVRATDFAMKRLDPADSAAPAVRLRARIAAGIGNAEAVAALHLALHGPAIPHLLISPRSPAAIREELAQLSPLSAPASPSAIGDAGAIEQRVHALWSASLGLAAIGRDEDFFALGGDSVLAIQIVAQLREQGFAITAQQFFEHRTIAALGGLLAEATAPTDEPDAPLIELDAGQLAEIARLIDDYDAAPAQS